MVLQLNRARKLVDGSIFERPPARSFGNFEWVFDQLIKILGRKREVFRPILPPKGTPPPPEAPWWAAGRDWPRPFHQLVKLSKGSLRALQLNFSRFHDGRFWPRHEPT
jgi:hypothetical protein